MNKVIITAMTLVEGLWFLSSAGVQAQEQKPATIAPLPTLPFSIKVTEEKFESPPDYMNGPKNPGSMDFPYGPVMIDGEFWVFYWNPAGKKTGVLRYKGTSIENAVRQPDGDPTGLGAYMLGGVWFDAKEKKLYAPLHSESAFHPKDAKPHCFRQIRLASSPDMGLTWKNEGTIISEARRSPQDYQTRLTPGGVGDHLIYVDEPSGYVYIFTDHYTWGGARFQRHSVARCAMADKMAPGKWRKFYNGAWDEPGLEGKASYVNGYCVTYNTYLKKYLSFYYLSGVSICTDLTKQDWSPSFALGEYWGANFKTYAFWPTNAEKNDTRRCGDTVYVYSFFIHDSARRFRINLGEGVTTPDLGFAPPSVWFEVENRPMALLRTMDPGHLYDIESFPLSADPIEARKTRSVDCLDAETKYSGAWAVDEQLPDSHTRLDKGGKLLPTRAPLWQYQGKGKSTTERGASMEFTFNGKDIYWRALKGPKQGKADVYLDGVLQTTVDCSASHPLVLQYAFIKRGLSGTGQHTIKVVAKGEKGQLSSDTAITHLMFEESIE